MRLATIRRNGGTVAARVDGTDIVELDGVQDVGTLLAQPGWAGLAAAAGGNRRPVDTVDPADWAPVVPAPSKIVCVGLNYRNHILEMGRELPQYPTLFAKYPEALIGPHDDLILPPEAAEHVDWEGELAVVVGTRARRVAEADADASIAGYTVLNDVTMRDYQYRSVEWFQGKTFESSSPLGPVLVTADELPADAMLHTEVNGETVQKAAVSDLVFSPAALVSYISHIVTLNPGDVIATGTPGGVGHARKPPRYLAPGDVLRTSIDGIGSLVNRVAGGD